MKGDWMKKVLLTILGASTLLATLCIIGCGTEPRGTEGKITVSSTSVTGSNVPVTVTLKDPDITDTAVTLKVTSYDYPLGVNLILTGKNGTFTGTLNFSTTIAANNSIRVIDGDLVTITYKDAFPVGDRTAKVTWNGAKGTITLDKAAYSSITAPITITVTDLDMAAPELDVDIITTTYNSQKTSVILKAVAGSYGTYRGQVYFTAGLSAGNDTIRVKDGDVVTVTYNDDVPPGISAAVTATWHGVAGKVAANPAAYTGLTSKMTITVQDSDVVDPSVTVKVKSQKDTAGISVVLNPVAGSAGAYSGQVGFSLNASTAGSVIAVQNNDQITISYNDIAPAAVRTGTATWSGALDTLTVDSASYHGTTSKMAITLKDQNIADTMAVVNVKSKKDTAGISITLKGQNYSFSGQVGFSSGASTASAIAVKDSDTVTVSIVDLASQTASATANFYSALIPAFGIVGTRSTSYTAINASLPIQLLLWNGGTIDSVDSVGEDGNSKAWAVTGTGGWEGFGWAAFSGALLSANMTTYAACTLHVSIKCSTPGAGFNLLVENLDKKGTASTGNQTWVSAGNYGFLPDGQWHDVAIPLSAWAGTCDLSDVDYFLGVSMNPYTVGETVVIDNLYWTLP